MEDWNLTDRESPPDTTATTFPGETYTCVVVLVLMSDDRIVTVRDTSYNVPLCRENSGSSNLEGSFEVETKLMSTTPLADTVHS
jgi:hypothetical protein